MRALLRKPGEDTKIVKLCANATIEDFQKLVGGYVEYIPIGNNAACLVDEEGTLKGLDYCCTVTHAGGSKLKLYGPVLFIGTKSDGFTSVPLWAEREYGGK